MLKKWLMLLTAMLMIVPACAESETWEPCAEQLVQELPLLLRNEAYLQMYSSNADTDSEVYRRLLECRWTKPVRDVYLRMDAEGVCAMLAEQGTVVATEWMERFLPHYAPTLIQNAVSSLKSAGELSLFYAGQSGSFHVDPAAEDGVVTLLRFYEDGSPLMIGRSASGGAVNVYASVLAYADGLEACTSAADVQAWLDEKGLSMIIASDEPVSMPVDGAPAEAGAMEERVLWCAREMLGRLQDPDFARIVVSGDGEIVKRLEAWAAADVDALRLMLRAEIDESVSMQLYGYEGMRILADGSSPAARMLRRQIPGSLTFNLIMGRSRTAVHYDLAATSISCFGTMYADPAQPDGMGVYFLLLEDGHSLSVTWHAENGVVFLNAGYLPIPALADVETQKDMTIWLMNSGLLLPCMEIPMNQ